MDEERIHHEGTKARRSLCLAVLVAGLCLPAARGEHPCSFWPGGVQTSLRGPAQVDGGEVRIEVWFRSVGPYWDPNHPNPQFNLSQWRLSCYWDPFLLTLVRFEREPNLPASLATGLLKYGRWAVWTGAMPSCTWLPVTPAGRRIGQLVFRDTGYRDGDCLIGWYDEGAQLLHAQAQQTLPECRCVVSAESYGLIGHWIHVGPVDLPVSVPGDCNGDGAVDFADINGFVAALGSGDLCADLNGDGRADLGDIGPFVGQL